MSFKAMLNYFNYEKEWNNGNFIEYYKSYVIGKCKDCKSDIVQNGGLIFGGRNQLKGKSFFNLPNRREYRCINKNCANHKVIRVYENEHLPDFIKESIYEKR
jgi:hypothetical protein